MSSARPVPAAQSAASPPLARSSRFAGCVSAHGRSLAKARVILHKKVDRLVGLFDRPIVARRYFPRICPGVYDKPIVDEFVLCIMDNIPITNGWIGSGELNVPEAHGERARHVRADQDGARLSIYAFLFGLRQRDSGGYGCLAPYRTSDGH